MCIFIRVNLDRLRFLFFLKILGSLFNIIFLLFGRVGIGIGIWIRVFWCYVEIVYKWYFRKMDVLFSI